MFNKLKKGFTLVELIIVMIVVGVISSYVYIDYSKPTENSKIESMASIFKNYHLTITMYSNQSDYIKLEEKMKPISDGDEDILDELVKIGVIETDFPKDYFEEPDKATIEIRSIKVDGYKRLIYLYTDSTNERDKYLLDKAVDRLKIINKI